MRKIPILLAILVAGATPHAHAYSMTDQNRANERTDKNQLTEGGAVYLRGQVDSYNERSAIERQVRLSPGVARVHNDITVRSVSAW